MRINIAHHYTKSNNGLFVEQKIIDQQIEDWNLIVKQAEEAGLISSAGGGTVILLHPRQQLETNQYHRIQLACGTQFVKEEKEGKCLNQR
jgi:hypothetical protein